MKTISFKEVTKTFGKVRALDQLDLEIREGDIFALLGHNGAGKTTALRIMLGLIEADSGEISVFGYTPQAQGHNIRSLCGVLAEDTGLYEPLTVYENLSFYAQLYGMGQAAYEQRIDELLEMFEIADKKQMVIKGFSTGMKKKVALIRALLHTPRLLLLDEPTNGLDPVSTERLRSILLDMANKSGTTIIMTTHNLPEVQKTCNRIAVMRKGTNVYTGDMLSLKQDNHEFDLEKLYMRLESEAIGHE